MTENNVFEYRFGLGNERILLLWYYYLNVTGGSARSIYVRLLRDIFLRFSHPVLVMNSTW